MDLDSLVVEIKRVTEDLTGAMEGQKDSDQIVIQQGRSLGWLGIHQGI